MGFFKSKKAFFTAFINKNYCEVYYRKIGADRAIIDEKFKKITYENDKDLKNEIINLGILNEKNLTSSVVIDDKDQQVFMQSGLASDENFIFQNIDKNFTCAFDKKFADALDEKCGIKFDFHTSLFKILYFLYKNQNFSTNSLYALKAKNKILFLIANKNEVFFTDLVLFDENCIDSDREFLQILKDEIDKFYKTNDSDFIENIAIYSDDELNHELGYVVFTQIFIKTEIHFVNICEYTNKISIKETY